MAYKGIEGGRVTVGHHRGPEHHDPEPEDCSNKSACRCEPGVTEFFFFPLSSSISFHFRFHGVTFRRLLRDTILSEHPYLLNLVNLSMNYVDNYLMEISLLIILVSFNGIYDAPSSHLQADVVLERSTNREYIRHSEGWFQSVSRRGIGILGGTS